MTKDVQTLLERHDDDRGALIAVLEEIQEQNGYLSEDALRMVSEKMDRSLVDIYGVATFYTQFRFNRPGEHEIKVCLGTACHVRGGENVMGTIQRSLGISDGETTEDGKFSLDRVACMGCCALAPVLVVDDKIFGNTSSSGAEETIKKYRSGGKKE